MNTVRAAPELALLKKYNQRESCANKTDFLCVLAEVKTKVIFILYQPEMFIFFPHTEMRNWKRKGFSDKMKHLVWPDALFSVQVLFYFFTMEVFLVVKQKMKSQNLSLWKYLGGLFVFFHCWPTMCWIQHKLANRYDQPQNVFWGRTNLTKNVGQFKKKIKRTQDSRR